MKQMRTDTAIGQRFGKLTVAEIIKSNNYGILCVCTCDCGNKINSSPSRLQKKKSCGCVPVNTKHGLFRLKEYNIWIKMMQRCYDKDDDAYPDYGGRGILVCRGWHRVENFIHDMGARPSKQYTIDRVNNDRGYSKANCRWATRTQQARNKRSNIVIDINGDRKSLPEWAEIYNIDRDVVWQRLKNGSEPLEALTTKKRLTQRHSDIQINGVNKSLVGWARHFHLNVRRVQNRVSILKWDYLKALEISK